MEIGGFSENHASQACQVSKGFGRLPCPATITSGQPILEAPKEKGTGKAQSAPAPLPKITSGPRGRCARSAPTFPNGQPHFGGIRWSGPTSRLPGPAEPFRGGDGAATEKGRCKTLRPLSPVSAALQRAGYYPSVRSPQSRPPRLGTRLDGTWVGPGQLMKHQLPPTSKCCTYLPSSAAGCGMRLGSGAEWQTERLASGMMWYCPEHSSPSTSESSPS